MIKRIWVSFARGARVLVERLGVDLRRSPRDGRTRIWLKSLVGIYDAKALIALDTPWWTFAAAERVEQFLAGRPGARVFEWGSGASSVWLSSRAGIVVSVEHDEGWSEEIAPFLPGNVTLLRVAADRQLGPDPVLSARHGEEGRDFRDYVEAIDHQVGTFDLIVIDGRAREACLDHAVGKLADGGLIVFDNVDRERYRKALNARRDRIDVEWTRGLTPSLPYPTRTAVLRVVAPR